MVCIEDCSRIIVCVCVCVQVQVYKFVVEDVIRNVKEDFLNEGVEPEVLDQLQEVRIITQTHTHTHTHTHTNTHTHSHQPCIQHTHTLTQKPIYNVLHKLSHSLKNNSKTLSCG